MRNNNLVSFFKEKFEKSDFSKNVFTLMTGTAVAQIIPLIIAPVLSRIYTPQEFGRLALYLSIVQILGAIANGRYELAIVLPKEKRKGIQLTMLSVLITILVSIVSLIAVLLFSTDIAKVLGDPKLDKWLYLVPISVLMIGVFNALNYFSTREKAFKDIAKANIFKAFGGNSIQLSLGLLKYTGGGLIIGQVFSHFFGNIKMLSTFIKHKKVIKSTRSRDLKQLAKRYIDFPKFSMWGIFLNITSTNITNFFISSSYGLLSLGHYSYAYKYLGLPISLIGNSISQVYFQKISERKENRSLSLRLFKDTLKKLVIIASFIFLPIFFIIEDVYAFVFGEAWRLAGGYAKILIPLFFIRFVVVPLTITISVYEKQKLSFLCHIGVFFITIAVLFFSSIRLWSITEMLIIYSVSLMSYYLYLLFIIKKVIKKSEISG